MKKEQRLRGPDGKILPNLLDEELMLALKVAIATVYLAEEEHPHREQWAELLTSMKAGELTLMCPPSDTEVLLTLTRAEYDQWFETEDEGDA